MSRGLSRSQIGVTEAMVESFGETIFGLSHNLQRRRGDPVRLKDFDDVERQRADLGLSDAEIADRIGLSRDQVTFIRNLVERRKIRRNHYQRLLELGGGRRFRAERFTPHEERATYGDAAMSLREAMRFDGERAALYLERGWWSPADTLSRWLVRAAAEAPDTPAIAGDGQSLTYGELSARVAALAGGLKALGLGPGDVVAVQLPNRAEYLVSYLAICAIGGVMTTLYLPYRAAEMESLLGHSGARAFIGLAGTGDFSPVRTALGLRSRIDSLEHVVVLGDAPDGAVPFDELTRAAPHDLAHGPVAADPVPAALHLGHLGPAQGGAARLPGHSRQRPARGAGARNHGRGPDRLRRALRTPLRAVQLPPGDGGGRDDGASACVHSARARARPGAGGGHRAVRRARPRRGLPRRRAAGCRRGVRAASRRALRERGGAARREGAAGADAERARDTALGDDRDPGRPLYPAGRSDRDRRRLRRPSEPGHRGAGGRPRRRGAGGRRGRGAPCPRPPAVPGLLQPPGGEPRGVLCRRLVPHRRPRGRRRRRKRRDHRPMQGRDQPGRRQVQPPRHRGPARRASTGRHGRDRSGTGPGAGRAGLLLHHRRRRPDPDAGRPLRVPRRERRFEDEV